MSTTHVTLSVVAEWNTSEANGVLSVHLSFVNGETTFVDLVNYVKKESLPTFEVISSTLKKSYENTVISSLRPSTVIDTVDAEKLDKVALSTTKVTLPSPFFTSS